MLPTQQIESALKTGIASGIFPGAAIAVVEGREIIAKASAGRATYAEWSPAVTTETIFDLASLTKPLVTALTIAALYAQGMIQLSDTIAKYLHPTNPVFEKVTLRQLLAHASGLPAHKPLYNIIALKPENIKKSILSKSILAASAQKLPDETIIYSDLGYMLLGIIVEKITSMPLCKAWEKLIQSPLEIKELFFPSSIEQPAELSHFTPTELCPVRKKVIWGEVHDLNCWALGGVAGHAGLFGSAVGVAKMLIKILQILKGSLKKSLIPPEIMHLFLSPVQAQDGTKRALGFDIPSPSGSQAGTYFKPEHTVGHLGFTGTSFWLDIQKEVGIVLLTNRTFPKATQETQKKMAEFRPYMNDFIWNALFC